MKTPRCIIADAYESQITKDADFESIQSTIPLDGSQLIEIEVDCV